jgi:asparagine synthase (glutamine-hydrolysing)
MSGILGIWNLDGQPVATELLSQMSVTLAHRGPDGEGQWLQGQVGLACQLMRVTPESLAETQPLIHPSGPVVVFDGRLDNREELLRLLRGAWGAEPDSPDPALVLAAYETFGDKFPEYLNGDFVLAVFDPRAPKLVLARDAVGIRTLYYHRVGDTFIFASEIKTILAHPRVSTRPNDEVIAGIFFGGDSPDGPAATCFTGVFSLLPAHQAALTPRRFDVRRYWDFDLARKIRFRSFPEYVEAFRHLFAQAVGRRLRSAFPVAVTVSGGLDSSSIFCQAEQLRRQAPADYPPLLGLSHLDAPGSRWDEDRFVEAIERAYGLTIQRVPLKPRQFMDGVHDAAHWLESANLSLQWDELRLMLQSARQSGARVVMGGYWGDQLLYGWGYFTDLFRQLAWKELRRHWQGFTPWLINDSPWAFTRFFLRNLIVDHIPWQFKPLLRRLRARLSPGVLSSSCYTKSFRDKALRAPMKPIYPQRPRGSAHARSLYTTIRERDEVLVMEFMNKMAARSQVESTFPFLDRDLIAFLMAIPGEVRNWGGVPRMLQRQAMAGVLPLAIAQRRDKADFTALYNEALMEEYPRLAEFVKDGMLAARYGYLVQGEVSQDFLVAKDLISGGGSGSCNNIKRMIGLEIWLRVFWPKGL